MLTISKEIAFEAAHFLAHPDWDEQKNRAVYGKCNNIHGHNYRLIVSITGPVQADGMIMNFTQVTQLLLSEIESRFDHILLNKSDFFKDKIPTVENFCLVIRDILQEKLKCLDLSLMLKKIVLYETETSFAALEL